MAPPGKLSMRDDRASQAGRQQKQVTHNNASDYYVMKAMKACMLAVHSVCVCVLSQTHRDSVAQ
jgi:hypothetical protein